ncbi:MAG: hypothetical protein RJA57_1360 [Bacteroidota bacterium]|jgi:CDP-diacylglycerol--glycerol-3-phosphate 3-phosphatidyltransferase
MRSPHRISYYLVNGITAYRVITAPLLLVLLYLGQFNGFRWLLVVSFFTDAIDGFLARRFRVTSTFGTRLDSLGDDLTVVAGALGLLVVHPAYTKAHWPELALLVVLFLVESVMAVRRYGKMSGFHTYAAKAAAILQGVFLILSCFLSSPPDLLFHAAVIVTAFQLLEEIVLIRLLPQWETDVKGYWWVRERARRKPRN